MDKGAILKESVIAKVIKHIKGINAKTPIDKEFKEEEELLIVSVNKNHQIIRAKCSKNDYWDFNYKEFIKSTELLK